MSEITAIISAGGAAIRMRPLSLHKPKAMIPFLGRPLLYHLVTSLKLYKITKIIIKTSINTAYDRTEVEDYFSTGGSLDLNIKYYQIKEWFGTAGTTKNLITEMERNNDKVSDPVIYIYGDSLIKVDYQKMLKFHRNKNAQVTVLFHRPNFESFLYEYHDVAIRGERRTNYGVMDIDLNNRITQIVEKPLVEEIRNNFVNPVSNAAVYIINKEVFDLVSPNVFSDFPKDLFPLLLESGTPCYAFDIEDGYRFDIGAITDFYTIQLAILNGKLDFEYDFPVVQEGIGIASDSQIASLKNLQKPVLICENSRVGTNTFIENSIIGNNVRVGNFCSIKGSIILDNSIIGDEVTISKCIVGENTLIDNGVSLPENTVLGSHCYLGGFELTEKKLYF